MDTMLRGTFPVHLSIYIPSFRPLSIRMLSEFDIKKLRKSLSLFKKCNNGWINITVIFVSWEKKMFVISCITWNNNLCYLIPIYYHNIECFVSVLINQGSCMPRIDFILLTTRNSIYLPFNNLNAESKLFMF